VGGQSRFPFATRYSLLAAVLPVANRQSPLAVHYSLLAIRYSPSFSVRQEPRPPIFPVPRPTPLVQLKVGAQFFRHQLRTEVRSMDDLFCADGSLWCKTANETFRILSQAVYMLSGLR